MALSRRRPRPRRLRRAALHATNPSCWIHCSPPLSRRGRRRPARQLCPRRPPAARARMGRARLAAASARQLGARFLAGGGCGRGRVGHRSQPRGRARAAGDSARSRPTSSRSRRDLGCRYAYRLCPASAPLTEECFQASRREKERRGDRDVRHLRLLHPLGQPPPLRRRRFHAAPRRRRRGPRAGGRRVQRDGACRRGVATKPGPGLPRRQLRRAAVLSSGRARRGLLRGLSDTSRSSSSRPHACEQVRRDVLGYERQREHRPGVAGDRRQAEAAGEPEGGGMGSSRLHLGLSRSRLVLP